MAEEEKPVAELEYELEEPILAYKEEVKVLKMRRPIGADLIRVGNPVIFYPHTEPPKIEHDMIKMQLMIARLSNIPSASIEKIGTRDLLGIAWMLSPFFIPAL